MTKFALSCVVTVGAYTYVEAESLAEAIEIAETREVVFHTTNSGTDPDESWCVEEPDGAPMEITGDAE